MKIINIIIQFYYKLFWSFLNADIGIIVQIKCVYKQRYQGSIFIHGVARKAEKIMTDCLNQI